MTLLSSLSMWYKNGLKKALTNKTKSAAKSQIPPTRQYKQKNKGLNHQETKFNQSCIQVIKVLRQLQ